MVIDLGVLSWVVVIMAVVVILGGFFFYVAIKLVSEKVATILEAHNEIITEDRAKIARLEERVESLTNSQDESSD